MQYIYIAIQCAYYVHIYMITMFIYITCINDEQELGLSHLLFYHNNKLLFWKISLSFDFNILRMWQ